MSGADWGVYPLWQELMAYKRQGMFSEQTPSGLLRLAHKLARRWALPEVVDAASWTGRHAA